MKQHTGRLSRRQMLGGTGATLVALGVLGGTMLSSARAEQEVGQAQVYLPSVITQDTTRPVIVLVHGAWADGNSWAKVIRKLQDDDYTVIAPAVGLMSLAADIASVRKVVTNISSPVLLVGHSYGGAVISGAGSGLSNVKGLVYVAAYAPDTGELILGLNGQFDAQFGASKLGSALRPDGPLTDPSTLIYLDQASFHEVFAQDVEAEAAAILATTQRAPTGAGFAEPFAPTPAWKTIPSWYQVSTADRVLQPEGQRFMAQRMNATTIELDASHVSLVSQPRAIMKVIEQAATAVMETQKLT